MKNIAVLVSNTVQFYSVKPLLEAMNNEHIKYDLILPNWDTPEFREEGWTAMENDLEEVLNQLNIAFLKASFVNTEYKVSMSPYPLWWDVKSVFKVSYNYGYIPKAYFHAAPENKLCYDYILCYGKIDEEFFSAYAKTCIIGEPKLLDYKKKIIAHKKSKLLYLPTYGRLSSIRDAVPVLKNLSSKYEVCIKAHHGTSSLASEKDNLSILFQEFSTIYDSKTPLYDLLAEADVVLSDNSGAIYDALATGVPVARFSTLDPETIEGFVTPYLELAEKGILPSTNDPKKIEYVLDVAMTDTVRELQGKVAGELFFDPKEGKNNFIALMRKLTGVDEKSRLFCLQREKNKYRKEQNQNIENLSTEIKKVSTKNTEIQEKYRHIKESYENLQESYADIQKSKEHFEKELKKCNDILAATQANVETQQIYLKRFCCYTEKHFQCYKGQLELQITAIQKSLDFLNQMLSSRMFKLIHLWGRIKKQLILGSFSEKKKFFSWLFHRSATKTDGDHRFLPLFSILDTLRPVAIPQYCLPSLPLDVDAICRTEGSSNGILGEMGLTGNKLFPYIQSQIQYFTEIEAQPLSKEAGELRKIIRKGGYRGILIYPCIVRWEPLQTPQQILRAFAAEGWLCLFCDYPGAHNSVVMVEENLYLTTEKDVLQAAEYENVTILLTWMGSIPFVDRFHNKKLWYHILDQLDIFHLYDNFYETLHAKALNCADWVSYVASPLMKCIKNRDDAIYLPNGCFVRDLSVADLSVPPDLQPILRTGRKIIGYFGYMAEWMDYDLVEKAALARPEYEFVFIGDVVVNVDKLRKISNVHFLGLKKYNELPAYACRFDVATIPFLINPMMDCVSPIKFYEYCAYGKPVISSRMKELEAYECDFIACIDDLAGYLEKLDRFVSLPIQQLAQKEAPTIAKDNSWSARAKKMEKYFIK